MRTWFFASAAVALGLPTTGQAHHAINAQFDVARPTYITGTLTRIDNLNPHSYWRFDVKGANNQVQKWNLESLAPAGLRRAGLRIKQDLKVGQSFKLKVFPARNGTNSGLLTAIVVNGKEYQLAGN